MSTAQEPFTIAYNGVSIKVNPLVKDLNMQYLVNLPTRKVIIETRDDEDEISYWVEVPGGRTKLAGEIGEIIENLFL